MKGLKTSNLELRDWVELWANCYDEAEKDAEYLQAIKALESITPESFPEAGELIKIAFKWKNGGALNQQKNKSISRINYETWQKAKIQRPDHFSGAVWNIFLWHLATHGEKPIFDQHCWRAYCHITRKYLDDDELEAMNTNKKFQYYEEYEKWFKASKALGVNERNLDKAMMAYGQFIASQFKSLLGSDSAV